MLNPSGLKSDFPILSREVNGNPLVYLDNAATSQKPRSVVEAIVNYYYTSNANVHRGVHTLSDESTQAWEKSRETISKFFGADTDELIITRNTTEALNGVAYGWADHNLKTGDVILSTLMEHHSDLVVWQEVCRRTGARLEYLEIDDQGRLVLSNIEEQASNPAVKLLAVTHVSNALGTKNPIETIIERFKKKNPEVVVVVDGAQSAPHISVDFHKLGADFYVFSGHKMLGPMGIGGLLVAKKVLQSNTFRPWLFGGGMIATVERQQTTYADAVVDRFTPGTPDVASIVGLAAACEYLQRLGMTDVAAHDAEMVQYALNQLRTMPQVTVTGPTVAVPNQQLDRVGSVSFIYQGVHAHDVAQVLDSEGVAVRSGHHCTMPLHKQFNWQASVRLSFQVYNSVEDIDILVTALQKVASIFGK